MSPIYGLRSVNDTLLPCSSPSSTSKQNCVTYSVMPSNTNGAPGSSQGFDASQMETVVLGTAAAIIGIAALVVAYLQLRRMQCSITCSASELSAASNLSEHETGTLTNGPSSKAKDANARDTDVSRHNTNLPAYSTCDPLDGAFIHPVQEGSFTVTPMPDILKAAGGCELQTAMTVDHKYAERAKVHVSA
ncbi:hypothetical protein NA57DRAFT_74754 [Rhizodiscina lignyota]|uniref:Uncharacterized protein n=1 Tax=Rhizodiscina lignyota TaxID=1504668 RepID=A0A9P4MB07_9PEZI|nr:hypothetical protein NA57DRAFT_74754 [Rhizodiscina lignyota]